MILPYKLVGSENAFSHLAGITGSPEVGEKLHDLRVVVRHDVGTVGTFSTLVISDDCSKTEHDTLGKFTLTLQISLETGKVASLEFREGVKHD